MPGYSPSDNLVLSGSTPISGVVTGVPVTRPFTITEGGSLNFTLKLVVSGTVVAGSIVAKLQTAIDSDWVDSKTVTITADGIYYIRFNIETTGDQTYLPLLSKGQIVVTTTNAGDATTFTIIKSLQAL